MEQKKNKKISFNKHSYILSAMVNYWEQHGQFNLSLYTEVIKAKMQKINK